MNCKVLLLLFSFVMPGLVFCQQRNKKTRLKYETFRIGLDPVKSLTIPFTEKKPDEHKFYWRTFQLTGEVIFNIRTSICLEGGFESVHRRLFNTTVDYFSKGPFVRAGLNYKLSNLKAYKQYGIGWRVGLNSFGEQWNIRIYGKSWDTELISKDYIHTQTVWGEVLWYQIQPLSSKGKLKNFYIGADARIRFMNQNQSQSKLYGEWLPGFGPRREFAPGFHIRLVWQPPIRKILPKYRVEED